ncbi:unannotated protein [freshwater metagenome]|uniref:Unannotated protein n=1 Tax=freshwater metagenome TaxID=449393 RepID=A0A6J6VJ57_9ZZZZ
MNIGYKAPRTIESVKLPFVVATPKSRFAKKSAHPIKINTGASFNGSPPRVRYFKSIPNETNKVVVRIITMVISALPCEPIDIQTNAVPKPAAAPSARIKGLMGSPCESSGPLAKNAPTIANAAPIERISDKRSPFTKNA